MRRVIARLQDKIPMLPSFAAAMSFYFVVSLVPFLIVVSRLTAWLFSANVLPTVTGLLREALPPESRLHAAGLAAAVEGSGGLGLAGTLTAAWTASSGLNEMARAVHFIFSDARRPHPGGWTRRFKAVGLLAIWALAITAAAFLLVLIPVTLGAFHSLGVFPVLPAALGAAVRYPVAFLLLYAAFALTYAYIPKPEHRPTWREASIGGLVAAVCWTGTCLVFAYFLPRVWRVSLFHGVLSSALATLVWAYCGCWGVIVGACWAAALREG